MASQIPEDFGEKFEMSDVVLHTLNSGGKELHANKSMLAMYSPYFNTMFFSNFKEANEKHVYLQCDYSTFKEILRFIHYLDFSGKGHKEYEPSMVRDMYTMADMMDFVIIRELCEQQMLERPSVDMANAAHSIGRHDLMMKILLMGKVDVDKFVSKENESNLGPEPIFSKLDAKQLCTKAQTRAGSVEPTQTFDLEDVFVDLEEPRIDLTEEWPMSDVSLVTKNSQEINLYSNKAALACVSEHFKTLFYGTADTSSQKDETHAEIEVDAEYVTMKQILLIIHHCNSVRPVGCLHPVLLYDMYVTASEDNLNIPMIEKFCHENLLEQSDLKVLDVAVTLGLVEIRSHMMSTIPLTSLTAWMLMKSGKTAYLRNGEEVIIAPDADELVLSAEDLRVFNDRYAQAQRDLCFKFKFRR